eukprot:9955773-Alexandrium_andersonii.AAC.1
MSASLVGSEMCIRDSFHPGRCRAVRGHLRARVLRGMACARNQNHGSRGPVSYTHLTLPTICSV